MTQYSSMRTSPPPPVTPSDETPTSPLDVAIPDAEREQVKVNNVNLTELKNACDDALKRYLSQPKLFTQNHTHTDVRLSLGWASVFIAAGTAYYGYKVDFEQSKPVVWAGVIAYVLLSTIQTLYAYFIERDTVFVGKRKTFSKRIVSERLSLCSKTLPSTISAPSTVAWLSSFASPASASSTPGSPPAYQLSLTYVRSTSGGKSLLTKGKSVASKGYHQFFDANGVMDQPAFEKWVGGLVASAIEGKAA